MDVGRMDALARSLAGTTSRRGALRVLAASAGAGLLGLVRADRRAAAAPPAIAAEPTAQVSATGATVRWVTDQPATGWVDYGPTETPSWTVGSDAFAVEHAVALAGLAPRTDYSFRVRSATPEGEVVSRTYRFRTEPCPGGTEPCGGGCAPTCGPGQALDPTTCACVCVAGFADCDGDSATGCETALGTVAHCRACGETCDDGNACTDNACDPVAGCRTTNVADGTACGTGGLCQGGACVECVPGGTCAADADCCDDEVCIGGACRPRATLLSDPNNCGRVGLACAGAPCGEAVCRDGACATRPAPDGTGCDDGNACTAGDHCMAGVCMAGRAVTCDGGPVCTQGTCRPGEGCVYTRVPDGTACGDGQVCQAGDCMEPVCAAEGKPCGKGAGGATCCAGTDCCAGVCVDLKTSEDHCGACGAGCGGRCGDGVCAEARMSVAAAGGTSTAPGSSSGVLLSRYEVRSTGGIDWDKIAYRPRQFAAGLTVADPTRGDQRVDDAGAYGGWDVFPTYNFSVHRVSTRSDWTRLLLNRPATLAIVWRGGTAVPRWITGSWTKAGDVMIAGKARPTYRKRFAAGWATLGSVYDPTDAPGNVTRDTYWVLLAETDGLPSPAPTVPSGREVPRPNDTCPAWIHDRYTTVGPDGKTYPTWHPQIDPTYWCYHRHEHGSDPAHLPGDSRPAFGYAAARHGMDEPHPGFKNVVFDDGAGNRWLITQHFGSAGLARACNRFHTLDFVVRNRASGELLVDLHLMGDFGRAVANRSQTPLTPPTCPNQFADAAGSTGVRMLPSVAEQSVFYEPWRVDLKRTIFGFRGDFTINQKDSIVICNNTACDQPVATGKSGSLRLFTPNRPADGNSPRLVAGANSGVFYTDPLGRTRVAADHPMAVRQYIKPGLNLHMNLPIGCYDVDGWGLPFVCGATGASPTGREASLRAPN